MRNLSLRDRGSVPLAFRTKMTLIGCIVAWVSRKRIIKNIDNFSTTCSGSHHIIIYMLPLALFLLSRKIILPWTLLFLLLAISFKRWLSMSPSLSLAKEEVQPLAKFVRSQLRLVFDLLLFIKSLCRSINSRLSYQKKAISDTKIGVITRIDSVL